MDWILLRKLVLLEHLAEERRRKDTNRFSLVWLFHITPGIRQEG